MKDTNPTNAGPSDMEGCGAPVVILIIGLIIIFTLL